MKDGRTHLSHKTEHAVDMATGAIVAVTIEGADRGDTQTIRKTLSEARDQIETVQSGTASCAGSGLQEVVLDKGYHSTAVLLALESADTRSYVSEPDRGRRKWRSDLGARRAVYANRRRNRGERGKRLQRLRGERVERPFAHLYRTGRMRRTHLRGHENILKRLLVHSGALNLGLLMRQALGVGTPRGLQSRFRVVLSLLMTLWRHLTTNNAAQTRHIQRRYRIHPLQLNAAPGYAKPAFTTGS
jgi:transposase